MPVATSAYYVCDRTLRQRGWPTGLDFHDHDSLVSRLTSVSTPATTELRHAESSLHRSRKVQIVQPANKVDVAEPDGFRRSRSRVLLLAGLTAVALIVTAWWYTGGVGGLGIMTHGPLQPREGIDTGGKMEIGPGDRWTRSASLPEIKAKWTAAPVHALEALDRQLQDRNDDWKVRIPLFASKASTLMSMGKPEQAHAVLEEARQEVERLGGEARERSLSSLIFFEGVAGLRLGENENCILCRGESSCILPIAAKAVHQNPAGSRLAIKHFTELLRDFPDDLEARWLLNVAHMTLGEYPDKVDARYRLPLERFFQSAVDIGRFRDIGHLVGVNRLNQSGGSIMDDFDNDGWLDLAVTTFDQAQSMSLYRNRGDGRFEECTESAGISDQLGGLNCVQTDYNNDGLLDIYIMRGAWLPMEIRPTLLRNDGNWHFTDVTKEAGLLDPVNSNAAQWADYDNDGWLDLFVCCEQQSHRLYRNLGNGTFEEVGIKAGLLRDGQTFGKGCAWIDYDNDDYPDLFINYLEGVGQLYHNNRDGTFNNVTSSLGIDGPHHGFSCWAWDFNNDGWLDIFATSFDRSLKDVVKGLIGEPHGLHSNKLFLNQQGKGFQDVVPEMGLDMVFSTMGSNFGDFDNDGWLDMYLGTGEPSLSMLVPNRMFKNMQGSRFAEISASAGVAHLQKGHSVSCGDWDRDGNVDVFIQMGGAVDGDKYHNILFQNPGHAHAWLTVKLVGKKTNRAAL